MMSKEECIKELNDLGFVEENLWAKHTRFGYRIDKHRILFYWSSYGWQFQFHFKDGFSVRVLPETEKFVEAKVQDIASMLLLYKDK